MRIETFANNFKNLLEKRYSVTLSTDTKEAIVKFAENKEIPLEKVLFDLVESDFQTINKLENPRLEYIKLLVDRDITTQNRVIYENIVQRNTRKYLEITNSLNEKYFISKEDKGVYVVIKIEIDKNEEIERIKATDGVIYHESKHISELGINEEDVEEFKEIVNQQQGKHFNEESKDKDKEILEYARVLAIFNLNVDQGDFGKTEYFNNIHELLNIYGNVLKDKRVEEEVEIYQTIDLENI